MKKVLILAYDFPPYISVGGLRPFSWFKYFKEFDLEPIVITRNWEHSTGTKNDYVLASKSREYIQNEHTQGTIIQCPYYPSLANRMLLKFGEKKYRLLRKVLTGSIEFLQYFLPIGQKRPIYLAADDFLKKEKVDIIIATGDPFVLFHYAKLLGQKHNIPWIADYRDHWSKKEFNLFDFENIVRRAIEKKTIQSACKITTVSPFTFEQIPTIKALQKYALIENGFDHEAFEGLKEESQNKENLSFAFFGTIYSWNPIELLLNHFSEYKSIHQEQFNIHFYGVNVSDTILELVEEKFQNLKENIHVHPKIPYNELIKKVSKCNVLLLFNYYSFMGTKIFDCIALKRKILLCYADEPTANELKKSNYIISEKYSTNKNLQSDLIEETKSGISIINKAHLFNALDDLFLEFKKNQSIHCDSLYIQHYSRKNQVMKLADFIKNQIK